MKNIIIIVVIVLVLACAGLTIGLGGFGTGNGSGEGNQVLNSFAEEKQDEEPQDKEVIIKVEENKIYVGEEECVDIEDLTDKISKINSQGKDTVYIFEHEYAIKATYDAVKETLMNLEETLGISIDYGE
jgi:biopolymer transport protein ExbD